MVFSQWIYESRLSSANHQQITYDPDYFQQIIKYITQPRKFSGNQCQEPHLVQTMNIFPT